MFASLDRNSDDKNQGEELANSGDRPSDDSGGLPGYSIACVISDEAPISVTVSCLSEGQRATPEEMLDSTNWTLSPKGPYTMEVKASAQSSYSTDIIVMAQEDQELELMGLTLTFKTKADKVAHDELILSELAFMEEVTEVDAAINGGVTKIDRVRSPAPLSPSETTLPASPSNTQTPTIESSADQTSDCAGLDGHWVPVGSDEDYKVSSFCVMKFEAKNNGSAPSSLPDGAPWVSMSQANAQAACESLGPGYSLISNPQWLTMASEVAANKANWSGGAVGAGALPKGHTDDSPSSACPGSLNDLEAFVERTCTSLAAGEGEDNEPDQRRTFTLSSGANVWDISGNVWERTTLISRTGKPTPAAIREYEFSELTDGSNLKVSQLIPTNAVKTWWDDSWGSRQSIGKYQGGFAGNGDALGRGGHWNKPNTGGVFYTSLYSAPEDAVVYTGFRCVHQ